MADFYVRVKPDSKNFDIEEGTIPTVYVECKAENGKANRQLVERLEDVLDSEVGIISGAKSSRKKLTTNLNKKQIEERLS